MLLAAMAIKGKVPDHRNQKQATEKYNSQKMAEYAEFKKAYLYIKNI